MNRKKVAILLATYNGELYLEQQINSILENIKSCKGKFDFSILISDDSSTDETLKIIRELQREYSFIQLIDSERKGGVKKNFEYLIHHTPSDVDYMFFSDQDDYWLPNKINTFLDVFSTYDTSCPILLHSDLVVADGQLFPIHTSMFNSQKLKKSASFDDLLIQNSVTGCVMALNKAAFDIIKNIDIANSIMHDWYISLYVGFYGKVVFIDKSTILYRQHGGNQVGAKEIKLLSNLYSIKSFLLKIKDAKNSVNKTRKQAILFYNENINSNDEKLTHVKRFIDSFEKNPLHRASLFISGLRKQGLLRNVVFFIVYTFGMFKGE